MRKKFKTKGRNNDLKIKESFWGETKEEKTQRKNENNKG